MPAAFNLEYLCRRRPWTDPSILVRTSRKCYQSIQLPADIRCLYNCRFVGENVADELMDNLDFPVCSLSAYSQKHGQTWVYSPPISQYMSPYWSSSSFMKLFL